MAWISILHSTVLNSPSSTNNSTRLNVTVPDMGAGSCLGPEGNRVSLGRGVREGPVPPESKEDKQSVLGEGGGSMKKEGRVGRDEEGPARTE